MGRPDDTRELDNQEAVAIAATAYRAVLKEAWQDVGESYTQVRGVFLGSFAMLDRCGRYHHMLSPNEVTQRCIDFWGYLEKALEYWELVLEAGEQDATDVFANQYRNTYKPASAEEGTGDGQS